MHSTVSLKCLVCAKPSPGLAVTLRPALVLRWLAAGEEGRYISGESGTKGPGHKGGRDSPHPGRGFRYGSREGTAFELAMEDEQDRDLQETAVKEG